MRMTIRPAEHVQLGVQVDDHVPCVAAAIEQLVDGGKRLDRSLERSHGERRATGEHEGANRSPRIAETSVRASRSRNQKAAIIAMPAP